MRYGLKAILIAVGVSLLVGCDGVPDISPPTPVGGSADATADAVNAAEKQAVDDTVNVTSQATSEAAEQVSTGVDLTAGG